MSSEIEKLIQTQSNRGELISRFWSNTLKHGKDNLTVTLLEQRRELLNSYWKDFLSKHYLILEKSDVSKTDYLKEDTFTRIEGNYIDACSNISGCISDIQAPTELKDEASSCRFSTSIHSQLPKIELPTFSGNLLEWESFRDQFKKLVHEIPELSNVHKLLYLKSHLRGEAAEVIENTPVTSSNYQGAWADLEARYGSKRILSNFHMKSLFELSPMQKPTSAELKRVLDHFRQTIRAFQNLEKPIEHWDEWFVFFLVRKLDSSTRLFWELSLTDTTMVPKFIALSTFLETRIHALEVSKEMNPHSISVSNREVRRDSVGKSFKQRSSVNTVSTKQLRRSSSRCLVCSKEHFLNYCPVFKGLKPTERREQAQKLSLCLNCLSNQHLTKFCKSPSRCLACDQKHHTLLHGSFVSRQQDKSEVSLNNSTMTDHIVTSSFSLPSNSAMPGANVCSANTKKVVLLATVRLEIESPSGKIVTVRALLDTASDSSFVTEWVAQALQLRKTEVRIPVTGVQGCETGIARGLVNLLIRSNYDRSFALQVQALVLRKLTTLTPSHYVELQHWPHLTGLTLADPEFAIPSTIDLILGADVCGPLISNDTRLGPPGSPTARLTPFGWLLMGPVTSPINSGFGKRFASVMHIIAHDTLDLQKFWEMEEVPPEVPLSEEDELCEKHFIKTHSRDDEGRYTVRLPFKDNHLRLGSSRSSALKLFLNYERRLEGRPLIKQKYNQFMSEYLSLNHMEAAESRTYASYYLPHHAVIKNRDPSGKIRVVFNASFKDSSGHSLNDLLMPGPRLQPDLWMILTRWRFFKIAFTTDIVKMFRQIRVHSDDSNYQRILWRFNSSDPIKDYKLTTVTYGTASAPFLALRVLRQLAQDEQNNFPLGAQAIQDHSYVDDILSGADDLEQALEVKGQLTDLLERAGFPLSKWASNSTKLCPGERVGHKVFTESDQVATLGLHWYPINDVFYVRIANQSGMVTSITKRIVLSEIARLFDPLGWMAPVLIFAKIFMQDLWLANLEWDQCLPPKLAASWSKFRLSLLKLDLVRIPRWIKVSNRNISNASIHGFCDASERAYAAVVYLRVSDVTQGISVNLLVAKTKVAPVKTVSVPRLELCAAVLLTRLLVKLVNGLNLKGVPVFAWTDSKVTLAWIGGHASRWKPFVAHRVVEIQSALAIVNWNYVATRLNPADAATRGISPDELLRSPRWWHGPPWLIKEEAAWCRELGYPDGSENEELRTTRLTCHVSQSSYFGDVILKFSCLLRLLRTIALCLRFLHNSRHKDDRRIGHVTAEERANAMVALIKCSQSHFGQEIADLRRCKPLLRSSPLLPLKPFLDEKGILRVGGRLKNAVLSFDEKHPIIVPKQCHLAVLLIRHAHAATLHGGQQLTRSFLAQRYWIWRNRILVKQEIRACGVCNRFRGKVINQRIGDLPVERLKPQKPFLSTGVDYAGPVLLRTTKGRGHKSYKGYICLFICMSTKAVHLECVSDLSTDSFVLAFRRFISRRGRCSKLFSDNATNFRGADRELRSMFKAASSFYEKAAAKLSICGTDWIFNPPYAPHFGGLWEAGIKSTKYHLRRVIGDQALTFEEMSTLLCQIEACLNSRPLSPLSNDPNDLVPLTPGHFLIGEPLTALPEPLLKDNNQPVLNRFKLITRMRDHFWIRWSQEYLHQLQHLPKWRAKIENLEVDSLVLVKDTLLPPTSWLMARVIEVFPGADGLVRVAKLRTSKGVIVRPINKLCLVQT